MSEALDKMAREAVEQGVYDVVPTDEWPFARFKVPAPEGVDPERFRELVEHKMNQELARLRHSVRTARGE